MATTGGVAEWSIAPVLKTGNGQPFVSSNLTASAKAFVVTDVPRAAAAASPRERIAALLDASTGVGRPLTALPEHLSFSKVDYSHAYSACVPSVPNQLRVRIGLSQGRNTHLSLPGMRRRQG